MARKGQFKKGGGRIGGRAKRRRSSRAMTHSPRTHVVTRTRTRTIVKKAKRKGRSRHHGGGMKLTHLALTAAGLAFLVGPKSPISQVKDVADKIPGTKTFGAPAMIGLTALAIDRFVKPNKWLKLLGTAGVVLAAVQIGTQGTDFKFVGDSDGGGGSSGDFDLADGDDVGDDDVGDDDVGDDDMGDED